MTITTSSLPVACYHCGLPVHDISAFPVTINNTLEPMCCIGCQAVAMAIVDGGLESFYRFRSENSPRPDDEQALSQTQYSVYDFAEVQADFVVPIDGEGELRQAHLLIDGITCAACGWLIETHLKKQPAVISAVINVTTHRLSLTWDNSKQPLSELLIALAMIGYRASPATDEQQLLQLKKENRLALMRIGVAFFCMMQAMMVAVGMYTGASDSWLEFLRWQSMFAATPVVLFSAYPFFKAAWRSIKTRYLVMDLPVALAIGLAYLASCYAVFTGDGEIYFESVAMFAFFLLVGRWFEMRARHRNRQAFGNLAQLMPLSACCVRGDDLTNTENIPLKALQLGDKVIVKAGETFPCDGIVLEGQSSSVEALLTGEAHPVLKKVGDTVIAGTLNHDSPLVVEVTATGAKTQLSAIERLASQAAEDKPTQVTAADRMARFFIARLLIICVAVFAFWCWYDSSRAFWITLSVLVVTCPCALALAMPAALSAATANLRKRGFLVARGHVIETLNTIDQVIFDKTGTLTCGEFTLDKVIALGEQSEQSLLQIAAALEENSNHPLAVPFVHLAGEFVANNVKQVTGEGVEGEINAKQYRLGRVAFALNRDDNLIPLPEGNQVWLLLTENSQPLGFIGLVDEIRAGAKDLVEALIARKIHVSLVSGDPSRAVAQVANSLGITDYTSGARPQQKLEILQAAQAAGRKVLMMGDGINDIPVLSGADISVAMASASDLAQTRADSVLLNNNLWVIYHALTVSVYTKRIIAQNLRFSLTYNGLAVPLAAMGWVTPWMAAIGMTASSLVVIFNSLRLNDYSESSTPVND